MRAIVFSLGLLCLSLSSHAATPSPAPSVEIANASGEMLQLPRKGHQGVDIYLFWATWCPYCKALMPHLQSMLDEYGDRVHVYALNIREDDDPAAYLSSQGYDFTLVPEADPVAATYGIKSTPGVLLVDGDGVIQFNLYQVMATLEPGAAKLNNRQKAARLGPFWAAKIRQRLDELLQP